MSTNTIYSKMEGIHQPDETFNFSKINMISPTVIPGGNYFIKFRMNDIPLYIQTPKCKVKQGFLKSGKKLYCDLMFTRENEDFICWMENLENYCQKKIFENRQKWFETQLDEHDIENSFTSPLKLYKSGKFYISRTNVPSLLGNCSLKIYNEHEELVNPDTIKEEMDVISILEIQGIKCSARSFQIEMEIKQMLVMNPVNLFDKCILRKSRDSGQQHQPEIALEQVSVSHQDSRDIEQVVQEPVIEQSVIEEPVIEQPVIEQPVIEQPVIEQPVIEQPVIEEPIIEQQEPPIEEPVVQEQPQEQFQDKDEEEEDYSDDESDDDDYGYRRERLVINHDNDLMEIDLDLDNLQEEVVSIKKRDDIYYEMYREAKRKAKLARDLAIASYLEAKNIKNTYMIVDDEDDSDLEEDTFRIPPTAH